MEPEASMGLVEMGEGEPQKTDSLGTHGRIPHTLASVTGRDGAGRQKGSYKVKSRRVELS